LKALIPPRNFALCTRRTKISGKNPDFPCSVTLLMPYFLSLTKCVRKTSRQGPSPARFVLRASRLSENADSVDAGNPSRAKRNAKQKMNHAEAPEVVEAAAQSNVPASLAERRSLGALCVLCVG